MELGKRSVIEMISHLKSIDWEKREWSIFENYYKTPGGPSVKSVVQTLTPRESHERPLMDSEFRMYSKIFEQNTIFNERPV